VKAWLASVLARIRDGTLLPAPYYAGLDCDAAVDARDRDGEFDLAWVRACDQVDRLWQAAQVEPEVRAVAEDIRREGFLAVSRATGQHEIASYVSDDLDLIARGRLVGLRDPFLDRLWYDYERGEFPAPVF
jgi:hypothetical protein